MTPNELMQATGCSYPTAIAFASPINATIDRWGVKHVPEFVAQWAYESKLFTRLEENLNYSATRIRDLAAQSKPGSRWRSLGPRADELANNPRAFAEACYGGRMGNGPEGSGDGYIYRGRGLPQLTGRKNYQAYEDATGVKVIDSPGILTDPVFAADAAGWYWRANNCDSVADDIEELTIRIHGGTWGLDQRYALTKLARIALDPNSNVG